MKIMNVEIDKKTIRDTALNTIALSLISSGAIMIQSSNIYGFVLIGAGALVELIKYGMRYLSNKTTK